MSLIPICPKCGSTNTVTIEGNSGTTGGPDVKCSDCQWKGQPIMWVNEEIE